MDVSQVIISTLKDLSHIITSENSEVKWMESFFKDFSNKLEEVYTIQADLNNHLRKTLPHWEEPTPNRILLAVYIEVAETIQEVPYKWWKTKEFDRDKFLEEIADILHFVVSYLIVKNIKLSDMDFKFKPIPEGHEFSRNGFDYLESSIRSWLDFSKTTHLLMDGDSDIDSWFSDFVRALLLSLAAVNASVNEFIESYKVKVEKNRERFLPKGRSDASSH